MSRYKNTKTKICSNTKTEIQIPAGRVDTVDAADEEESKDSTQQNSRHGEGDIGNPANMQNKMQN
jgi:hypothetical protein